MLQKDAHYEEYCINAIVEMFTVSLVHISFIDFLLIVSKGLRWLV